MIPATNTTGMPTQQSVSFTAQQYPTNTTIQPQDTSVLPARTMTNNSAPRQRLTDLRTTLQAIIDSFNAEVCVFPTPTVQQSLRPAPRKKMSVLDRQLAAYMTAREIDGRPVDDVLLDMLKRGNRAKAATLRTTPLGRANVEPDRQKVADSYVTLTAARAVWQSEFGGSEIYNPWRAAALYATVGTGNCREFALITTASVVDRLKHNESVDFVKHKRVDHTYSVLNGAGRRVTVDGWSDGPAIDAVDGVFSRRSKDAKPLQSVGYSRAVAFMEAYEEAREAAEKLKPKLKAQFEVESRRTNANEPDSGVWSPTPLVGNEFAQRVRDRIDNVPSPPPNRFTGALKRKKHQLIATLGYGAEVRARAQEKLRLAEHRKAAQPITSQQVREMAIRNARRLGFDTDEATRHAAAVLDYARNLRQPVPRELRARNDSQDQTP